MALNPDQKADQLTSTLTSINSKIDTGNDISTDITKLKEQMKDDFRADILDATQEKLDALHAAIDVSKDKQEIKTELSGLEYEKLLGLHTSISSNVNATRAAVQNTLGANLNDIADDIQPLGKDSISEEEEGSPAAMIQNIMFAFQKLKLSFNKMITFDPAKKEALANQEKELMIQEFTMLGARGLREKFQVKGVEYGVEVRNGIRDKTAFTKFLELFKKEPGDINAFVDQQLAIGSTKIGASKSAPKPTETTLYGLMASKGRESRRAVLLGTEHTLNYPTGGAKYSLKFENNLIIIKDLVANKTNSYVLKTVGNSATDALTAATSAGGAPGLPAGALGLLGGTGGATAFTSAELEDDGTDNKRLGFSFMGKSGLMGLGKQRASVSIENEALKKVLGELALGDPKGLKKLVDRKVVAKGIFAKLQGNTEFKIEKVS